MVDGLNAIEKRYIYQLMSNVQLPGLNFFDSQILINSCTQKNDVSLSKRFQNNPSEEHHKHRFIDQGGNI